MSENAPEGMPGAADPNSAFSHSPETIAQAAEDRLRNFVAIETLGGSERLANSLMGVASALSAYMAHSDPRSSASAESAATQDANEPTVYTRIFELPSDHECQVPQTSNTFVYKPAVAS